jgi:hypothetical protein
MSGSGRASGPRRGARSVLFLDGEVDPVAWSEADLGLVDAFPDRLDVRFEASLQFRHGGCDKGRGDCVQAVEPPANGLSPSASSYSCAVGMTQPQKNLREALALIEPAVRAVSPASQQEQAEDVDRAYVRGVLGFALNRGPKRASRNEGMRANRAHVGAVECVFRLFLQLDADHRLRGPGESLFGCHPEAGCGGAAVHSPGTAFLRWRGAWRRPFSAPSLPAGRR